MKKIRINELARELEVKPGVIIDLLPELGVQEKKTHSSSVDEETAITLRERLAESGVLGSYREGMNGYSHDDEDINEESASSENERESTTRIAVAEEPRPEEPVIERPLAPVQRPQAASPNGGRAPHCAAAFSFADLIGRSDCAFYADSA